MPRSKSCGRIGLHDFSRPRRGADLSNAAKGADCGTEYFCKHASGPRDGKNAELHTNEGCAADSARSCSAPREMRRRVRAMWRRRTRLATLVLHKTNRAAQLGSGAKLPVARPPVAFFNFRLRLRAPCRQANKFSAPSCAGPAGPRYSLDMLGSSAQIAVRRARIADAKALAEVFAQSWRYAYRAIIPHLHLETMIQRRGPEWWQNAVRAGESVLVMEVGGKLAGYATWGASRTRGTHQGEIYGSTSCPSIRASVSASTCSRSCRHQLDQRKMKGLIVWALFENTPAINFYWRRGGRPVGKTYDKVGGAKLEKIAFAWG